MAMQKETISKQLMKFQGRVAQAAQVARSEKGGKEKVNALEATWSAIGEQSRILGEAGL